MAIYRILSLDGGGIRGVFTARLLENLARRAPGFLEKVDLFAGTSTGGILALALAQGLAPEELVALYRDRGARIFGRPWYRNVIFFWDLLWAKYGNAGLREVLEEKFGDLTLEKLPRKVLISSFDLDDRGRKTGQSMWRPKFFHNFPGGDSDGRERVVDVALSTSAAPTYFPSFRDYVDGGVVANDPSMAALAQALDKDTGGQALENIRLLSLSTGLTRDSIRGRNLNWGIFRWAPRIAPLMLEGVMGVAEYQCRRILGDHYCRVGKILPENIPLDAAARVEDLIRLAEEVDLGPTVGWMAKNF